MKSPPLWAAQLLSIRLLWEFVDGRCRATSLLLAVIFRTPLKYHLHWAAHRTKDGWRIFQKEWSYLCFFYFWRFHPAFFFFLGLDCYKTASHITGSILSQYCKKKLLQMFSCGLRYISKLVLICMYNLTCLTPVPTELLPWALPVHAKLEPKL